MVTGRPGVVVWLMACAAAAFNAAPARSQPMPDAVAQSEKEPARRATPEQKAKAKQLATALAYGSLLLLVFVIGSWAILRFSRRYRAYLVQGTKTPTQSDDVWAMHRLPPDAMDGLEEDGRE